MFKFLKKYFEKPVEPTELHSDDIKKFFENSVHEVRKEVSKKISVIKNEIKEKIAESQNSLKSLENAKLKNTNISIREKQFMTGNRKGYLQRSNIFLKEVESLLECEISFIIKNYPEYLNNFTKSTTRSYRILQEFFSNELRDIAIRIRKIDQIIDDLKGDQEVHRESKIVKIKQDLEHMEMRIQKKKELSMEVKKLKSDLEKTKKEISKYTQDLADFKNSKEYKTVADLQKKKEDANDSLKAHLVGLYNRFSPLDRAFRKYSRIALENVAILEKYSKNSLEALKNDSNLKILDILSSIKKNINSKALVIKNQEKILDTIAHLNKAFFDRFLHLYDELNKKINDMDKELLKISILNDIKHLEKKIQHLQDQKKILPEKINKINDEYESINIDKDRHKIVTDIEELLNIKIELT